MATDTLKNRVRISTTLKPETNKLLKEFSEKTQVPISKIIESAIIKYISESRNWYAYAIFFNAINKSSTIAKISSP